MPNSHRQRDETTIFVSPSTSVVWNGLKSRLTLSYCSVTKMATDVQVSSKDEDLQPRLNRRRPFDLHWRKAPPAWQGNVERAYRRCLNSQQNSNDDPCCIQCGCRPCPYDHDEQQPKFHDVDFVAKLIEERNYLLNETNKVVKLIIIIREKLTIPSRQT